MDVVHAHRSCSNVYAMTNLLIVHPILVGERAIKIDPNAGKEVFKDE